MHQPDAPTRVLAGRYELHRRLGSGGAGTVWRAHDRALDRPVAIKLLHADLTDDLVAEMRFRTEATAAAKLTHPNAVQVYDIGRDGNDDYLVMELLEGPRLADLLYRGPLPAPIAAAIGAMVARALGAAHAAGIVHRDVKPENVLLTADGTAKLADFGVARVLGAAGSRLTRTGMVLGTARYLAPEQLRDEPIDSRADVYSLGVVLHEALTARPPFGDGTSTEIAARRLTTSLPDVGGLVADVPPGLSDVVQWATRLDPAERPSDGAVLAVALQGFAPHDAHAALARLIREQPTTMAPQRSGPTSPLTLDQTPPGGTGVTDTNERREQTTSTRAMSADSGAAESVAGTPPPPPSTSAESSDRTAAMEADSPSAGTTSESQPPVAGRWVLAAVAVLATAIALLMVLNGRDAASNDEPVETTDGGTEETEEPAEPPDTDQALSFTAAGDHDPPPGDRREHPDDVDNAIDGDLDTFWQSESYNSADLGGFPKDGVGMWARLDDEMSFERVEVTLSRDGGQLELWAGDGPPDDDLQPAEWGELVAEVAVESDEVQFEDIAEDVPGDTILLWFTDLPPGGRGFRAEVRDVRAFGR